MVNDRPDPVAEGTWKLWRPEVRRGTITERGFARESLQQLWNHSIAGVMRHLLESRELIPATGCAIAVSKAIAGEVLLDARKMTQTLLDASNEADKFLRIEPLAWWIENEDPADKVMWVGIEARLSPRVVAS